MNLQSKPKPKKRPYQREGMGRKALTFRSRVTAGIDLLPSIDGRSHWARIMRDIYRLMLSHAGGEQYVSEPRRLMARRVAAFEAELIHLEDKFALARNNGGQPSVEDLVLYGRLTGQQRRCLEAIGWERSQRDVTPSLEEYFEEKARRDRTASEAEAEDLEEVE